MKVAILNDTHCGVRNSSDIFLNYNDRFYTEVFFPYLKKHNITQILHLGDYYEHRKFVNFKALNANRKHFLEPMRDMGITMDIIPGNHDVYFKNTNELCSLKELLGYFTTNVNIIMKPKVLDYDGCKVAVIPWINNSNYEEYTKWALQCEASILGAHLELKGFDMMAGVPNPHGMNADVFSRFEMVLSGHFHTKSSRDNVHYLGSQMEFTWADVDDPKFFHVLDTDTREIEAVRNPITMFKKVIYDDSKHNYDNIDMSQFENKFIKLIVINKNDLYMFDKFVDKLQSVNTYELKIAESFEEYLGDNVEDEKVSLEDTTELLDSYVEAVDTDLDKEHIKIELRKLYTEAQNLEVV
jgi:predicted phosphodiesterase|tara:strand:- start:8994 stop:10055 length:1062 start_codon:yes stop_codon:yes gene_type:complete